MKSFLNSIGTHKQELANEQSHSHSHSPHRLRIDPYKLRLHKHGSKHGTSVEPSKYEYPSNSGAM